MCSDLICYAIIVVSILADEHEYCLRSIYQLRLDSKQVIVTVRKQTSMGAWNLYKIASVDGDAVKNFLLAFLFIDINELNHILSEYRFFYLTLLGCFVRSWICGIGFQRKIIWAHILFETSCDFMWVTRSFFKWIYCPCPSSHPQICLSNQVNRFPTKFNVLL